MTLAPGTRLGPYEIVAPLGSGGMGVVFTARDPRLGRSVAIKLLPPEGTSDAAAKQRFLHEARAASSLDHPNICTIHEIGETQDGRLYLVMAHYEGETLRERIARGPLALGDAIDVARQMGSGLAEAHRAGIVHRDVKPANVFITRSGVVKILDFGLAKLGGGEGITKTGTAVGTVAYMSPEQAQGREVDHRTDIWSLGVVFYEMLAGTPPFQGRNLLDLSRAILDREAAPLTGASSRAQAVVERALRKDRALRYQAVADLVAHLDTLASHAGALPTAAAPPPAGPSIAVLPFVNMSPDAENVYFSDGLSEEIINALTRLPGLRVIARTSAFRFRDEQNVRTVGEALGVRTVLEGSVRKAGTHVRITAQLIDAADESPLWSDRFDRELTDVFAIQDEIAEAIVGQLQSSLRGWVPERRPAQRQTRSVEAYEALVEGRHHWNTFTKEGAAKALACFDRALALDPDYPDALVSKAHYYGVVAWMFADPRDAFGRMNALATRALARDPDHGDAHGVLAFATLWGEHDWEAAERLFHRAIALAPGSPNNVGLYGVLSCLGKGKMEEAAAYLARALELDPLAARIRSNQARVLICEGRFGEAEACCRRALELDPEHPLTLAELVYALAFQEKNDEARSVAEEAIRRHGPIKALLPALGAAHALAGRRDEAMQLLESLDELARTIYVTPLTATAVHAALSELDAAYEWAGKSIDERDGMMLYLNVHPIFSALRADSRYPELLRRVNLG